MKLRRSDGAGVAGLSGWREAGSAPATSVAGAGCYLIPPGAGRAVTAQTALRRQRGFTLVELVVVLVVMALLAVVAVPRFFGNPVYQERAYYDEVSAALRYARNLAIGSGCAVRATLAAGSYSLNQQAASAGHCDISDTSFSLPAILPDGQPASGIAPGGVALAPPTTIVFDAAGSTSLGSNQVIAINSRSMTVHAGSGYVSP